VIDTRTICVRTIPTPNQDKRRQDHQAALQDGATALGVISNILGSPDGSTRGVCVCVLRCGFLCLHSRATHSLGHTGIQGAPRDLGGKSVGRGAHVCSTAVISTSRRGRVRGRVRCCTTNRISLATMSDADDWTRCCLPCCMHCAPLSTALQACAAVLPPQEHDKPLLAGQGLCVVQGHDQHSTALPASSPRACTCACHPALKHQSLAPRGTILAAFARDAPQSTLV
jgi:hypothetical protein